MTCLRRPLIVSFRSSWACVKTSRARKKGAGVSVRSAVTQTPSFQFLREALLTSRSPQMWMSVCPSVRPCVRPSVRVSGFFAIFAKSIWPPWHPQIPFAKRALLCVRSHLKIYPRMLPLMSKFYDHFFAKKCIFIKKVPSFTRYKNLRKSPKLVLTDSVILIDIVQKVLFSSWDIRHTTYDESIILLPSRPQSFAPPARGMLSSTTSSKFKNVWAGTKKWDNTTDPSWWYPCFYS